MVDMVAVQQQALKLDIRRLKEYGLVIIYDDAAGRLGAADVRQIVNMIVAVHPQGTELYQDDAVDDTVALDAATSHFGMTFLVDIPSIRLIPDASPDLELVLADDTYAILDLRSSEMHSPA